MNDKKEVAIWNCSEVKTKIIGIKNDSEYTNFIQNKLYISKILFEKICLKMNSWVKEKKIDSEEDTIENARKKFLKLIEDNSIIMLFEWLGTNFTSILTRTKIKDKAKVDIVKKMTNFLKYFSIVLCPISFLTNYTKKKGNSWTIFIIQKLARFYLIYSAK